VPSEKVLYEALYIVDTSLEDERVKEIVAAFEAAVVECGGEVKNSLPFTRKRLAYEIKGCAEGLYILTYFESDQRTTVDSLMRESGLIEDIVRCSIGVANPQAIYTGPTTPTRPSRDDEEGAADAADSVADEETAETEDADEDADEADLEEEADADEVAEDESVEEEEETTDEVEADADEDAEDAAADDADEGEEDEDTSADDGDEDEDEDE